MIYFMLVFMQVSQAGPLTLHHQILKSANAPGSGDGIQHFEIAPGLGGATVALDAKIKGKLIHVFPTRDLKTFDEKMKADPNFAFKQVNVPLFPMTNRLLPTNYGPQMKLKKGDDFEAQVAGIPVKMRLNNSASGPDAIPHHLHGLTFDQESAFVNDSAAEAKITCELHDFFYGYWTGKAQLKVVQQIKDQIFHYELIAKNIGKSAMPVGFGSHPYFQIPSGNPKAFKLKIPAEQLADIDNLSNVLPKGTFSSVHSAADRLNFSQAKSLPTGVIDNYFLLDAHAKKEVEMRDEEAKILYRFTALTSNIVGVQIYYPGEGSVIAVEFVTHHPDPRGELWKKTPTGMQILQPGETANYAYQIAVENLAP